MQKEIRPSKRGPSRRIVLRTTGAGLATAAFGGFCGPRIARAAPQLIRNGCISATLLQQTVDALVEHELLPARVDMSKHVNASYLPFPCS
jgi:hypothetical protein